MANIATCPKCAKQLGLPADVAMTDRAECPECQAVFSLSQTVQISLPVARILDPAESPRTAAEVSQPTLNSDTPAALASNTAPLKSWEERLKNALAKDSSDDAATSDDGEAGAVSSIAEDSSPPPSFEFELDLRTPADLEKDHPQVPAASKTLADFAAAVEIPAVSEKIPRTKLLNESKVADTVNVTSEPTVAEYLPAKVEEETTELAELAVRTVPQRQVARRGFPKVAAFAVGPIVGGLLGLYGLLWLQGAKADYLGLARVLPASMLPAGLGGSSGDSPIAEAISPEGRLDDEEDASLLATGLAAPELMAQSREPHAPMKLDASVQPASAAQRLAPAASMVRVSVDEFSALVNAAATALPEFLAADLATPESIRSKGQAYMALCRLAEHFDFAQQLGLAPSVQAKVRQALQLYESATSQAKHRQELSHIASRWWEYEQRPSAGIFLTGQVQKTQPAGTGMLCWVKLSEQSPTAETAEAIPVMFNHQRYQTGDQIGVVGSVISSPSEVFSGLSVRRVVRASYDFQLGI